MTDQPHTDQPQIEAVRLKHHAAELDCCYGRILKGFRAAKAHTRSLGGMAASGSESERRATAALAVIRNMEICTVALMTTLDTLKDDLEDQLGGQP